MFFITIFGAVGWLILILAARLSVAAVAIGYGIVLAFQIRSTEQKVLAFRPAGDQSLAGFDKTPTHAQRRAMRISLKLALRQTELTSLFPGIAHRTQQFVRPGIRL